MEIKFGFHRFLLSFFMLTSSLTFPFLKNWLFGWHIFFLNFVTGWKMTLQGIHRTGIYKPILFIIIIYPLIQLHDSWTADYTIFKTSMNNNWTEQWYLPKTTCRNTLVSCLQRIIKLGSTEKRHRNLYNWLNQYD